MGISILPKSYTTRYNGTHTSIAAWHRELAILVVLVSAPGMAQVPDLRADQLSGVPSMLYAGQTFNISWRTCNIGNFGTVNNWNDGVYFNPSSSSTTSGATLLYDWHWQISIFGGNNCFSPGTNFSGTPDVTITIPNVTLPYGQTVYILVRTNRYFSQGWPVQEQNYNNNVDFDARTWNTRPDLAIQALSATGPATPGSNLPIHVVATNLAGTISSGSSVVKVYLNTSPNLNGAPVTLYTSPSIPALAHLATAVFDPIVVLPNPLPPGQLHLVAKADANSQVTEVNENNNVTSTPQPRFELVLTQPAGLGSLSVTNQWGVPGHVYLSVFSPEPANATSPGTGWWGGLHIGYDLLFLQFGVQTPPFVGVLDAAGGSGFLFPAGSFTPLAGYTFWGVTRSFDPTQFYLSNTSLIDSVTF